MWWSVHPEIWDVVGTSPSCGLPACHLAFRHTTKALAQTWQSLPIYTLSIGPFKGPTSRKFSPFTAVAPSWAGHYPRPSPPRAAVAPRPRARSCTFCFCPPFKHVEAPDNRHFLQEAENPTFLLQKAVNRAMHIWEGRQKPEMKCKDMNAFSVAVFLIVSFVLNTSAVIVSSKSVVTLQPVSPNNLKHFPRVFSSHQVSHEPDKARSFGAAQSPSQQFHRSSSHFNLLRLRPRGNKRRAASRLGPIGVPLHGVRLVVGALPRAVYTTFLTFLYSSGPPSFSCSLS